MTVARGPGGARRVSVERADHSRVYVGRNGRGFSQRPFNHGGHEYGVRTYHGYGGRDYARYYRGYPYRGVYLEAYAPLRYYPPGFYGWAYNPWVSPVPYAWGWGGSPWYGYYGGYFTPYPVYPSASFWLTDYLVSQSLADAYQTQYANNAPPPAPVAAPAPLSPEVKQQIADEVQRQIALTNAESAMVAKNQEIDPASSGLPRLLADNKPHVFVVGLVLDLVDNSGAECEVTQGDVLQLNQAPPPQAPAADLVVLASRGTDCRKGNQVSVTLQDLQEMQNHLRATIDQGMGELQAKSGQGGLPKLPATATGPAVDAPFAAIAPPPDPNAGAELTQQTQEADKVEQEAGGPAGGPSAGGAAAAPAAPPAAAPAAPAAPVTVEIGQTIPQVTAALGNPVTILAPGPTKKIYVYKDMKITFVNGKVTDIK